jgi:DNA polymerase-3 subunit epsilon
LQPYHEQKKHRVEGAVEFIAIDVETANADLASICAVGLVHFKQGQVFRRLSFLINPEDIFDEVNVAIHGITPEDVARAPTMEEVFPAMAATLTGNILAHHTHFDRVALGRAAKRYGFPELNCRWLDTARVARRSWDWCTHSGYGLASLSRRFAIQFRHHDACEDAFCCGVILLRALLDTGLSLQDCISRATQPLNLSSGRPQRIGNPSGPLAGEVIVFTGAIQLLRNEAADLAAAAGCDVASGVTTDTTILVVGDQDLRRLKGEEKSSKHRKAEKLIAEGAMLRIISETDFCELVGRSETERCEDPQHGERTPMLSMTPEASRIATLVETVRVAKRERRFDDACALLGEAVDREEQDSAKTGLGVAPWYYEQLAIVYRKLGLYDDELTVLERYDRQTKAPGMMPEQLKIRLEKVRLRNRLLLEHPDAFAAACA